MTALAQAVHRELPSGGRFPPTGAVPPPEESPLSRPVRCVLVALASLSVLPVAEAAAQRSGDVIPGRYIVLYDRSVDRPEQETEQRERDLGFRSSRRYARAVKGFSAKLDDRQVDRLRSDPEVEAVVPDREVRATAPLVSGDSAPTGVQRMGAASGTAVHGAASTGVAVIDTGIAPHPDLNIGAEGKACTGTSTYDGNGHGTHVAGSIAAENDGAGVVGVAPGTTVYPVKVLDDSGSGSTSSVVCGIDWVAANAARLGIRVANMSLGGGGPRLATCSTTTDPEHQAICRATSAGVTFVVAAGTDGWDFDYAAQPDIPAVYPEVLTVTAVADSDGKGGGLGGSPTCRSGERDDRYASFSNFATTSTAMAHTIAGPGVCIRSTWPGGYDTISGTSMASPHVAGATALCIGEAGAAGPCATLTPAQIIVKMRQDAQAATTSANGFGFTGDPLEPITGRYYGYMTPAAMGATTTEPTPTEPTPTEPAPTFTSVDAQASSAFLQAGTQRSGGLSSLHTADGSVLRIDSTTSGTRTSAFYASYTGVKPGATDLSIAFRGGSSRSCTNSLSFYDFSTSTWGAAVDSRSLRTTVSVTTAPRTNAAYISSGGEVRVRVGCTTSRNFTTSTDLLRLRFQQPAG